MVVALRDGLVRSLDSRRYLTVSRTASLTSLGVAAGMALERWAWWWGGGGGGRRREAGWASSEGDEEAKGL